MPINRGNENIPVAQLQDSSLRMSGWAKEKTMGLLGKVVVAKKIGENRQEKKEEEAKKKAAEEKK